MITRAIVERVLSPYLFKVRIPLLDRVNDSSVNTKTVSLNEAVVCTLPGCDPNIHVGDVVFVSHDETEDDWTILGYLYRARNTDTLCNFKLNELDVVDAATLPVNTTIGEILPQELQCIQGVTDNIQLQIDAVVEQYYSLLDDHTRLKVHVEELEEKLESCNEEINRLREEIATTNSNLELLISTLTLTVDKLMN